MLFRSNMSQTMLQLVQQTAAELNLAVPTYVAGNTSQDVQQILALMNRAGYDLIKEHDWQALQVQYRFYTQCITTNATTVNGSTTLTVDSGTDISAVDSNWQVTGYYVPQDTNVVTADNTTHEIVLSQMASGSGKIGRAHV